MTSTINVYVEPTPNPATMKFITNKLLTNSSLDFPDRQQAESSPFAKELFKFSFVDGVFFANNFVTVTKTNDAEWDELIPILQEFVKGAVESELKITEGQEETNVKFTGTETEQKIQQILYDYVRPAIEMDGGHIAFKAYDEGVVTVILQGACSGCPSSTLTLKSGIEGLLKRMVPGVTEVVAEAV